MNHRSSWISGSEWGGNYLCAPVINSQPPWYKHEEPMGFLSFSCPGKLPAATDHQTVTALAMTAPPHPAVPLQGNWEKLDILALNHLAISFHWRNSGCLVRAYGLSAPSEEWGKIPPAVLRSHGCVGKAAQTVPLALTAQTLLYTLLRVTYWSWMKS